MPSSDFSARADLAEWMDGPCTEPDLRACLNDLEQVNRTVFVYRPTLHWLAKLAPPAGRPLHIVDVGCGGGDMLRRIHRWSQRRSLPVRLTGVDMNAVAIGFARERTPKAMDIHYVQGDAAESPGVRDVDVVLSSHMTHHLADGEIVQFLRWMESVAATGWFVNDLYRAPVPYRAFGLLARAMRWHRFIQHDGPVSVQRAFRPEDWQRYLSAANIADATVSPAWPGRLCVGRTKQRA
jgi:2-polyprenyl-3-methyl-5-hydroxy-6-metoxy-1,4-benzoquinol methylase